MTKRKPKAPQGLGPDAAKLYQAFLAVGQEAERQVWWLTEFAQRDLSDPILSEIARWEADAFVQNWSVRWNVEPFQSLFKSPRGPSFIIAQGVFAGPIGPSRPAPFDSPDFDAAALLEMQREAQRLLRSLWAEHTSQTGADGYALPQGLFSHLSIKGLHRRAHISTSAEPVLRFVGAMVCTLLAAGPLRFCDGHACHRRLFVPRREWQRFCSPRCTNRASQQAHRKKKSAERESGASSKRGGRSNG